MPKRLHKWDEILKQKSAEMSFRDAVEYLASRSPLTFYKRKGQLTRYPESSRTPILIDSEKYHIERDSFVPDTGVSYSGNFFDDVEQVFKNTPRARLMKYRDPINCTFTDMTTSSKNVYLSFVAVRCENCAYSFNIKDSDDVYESVSVLDHSSIVFGSNRIVNSHKVFFSSGIVSSSDVRFSTSLRNCKYCWNCHDLEHANYYIENKEHSPREYFSKIEEIRRSMTPEDYTLSDISHACFGSIGCEGCSWCIKCENLTESMNSFQISEGKNVFFCGSAHGSKKRYNTYLTGNGNDLHVVMYAGGGIQHCFYTLDSNNCSHVYYSSGLNQCSYCIGCCGLRNKSYCILNKQYSKEERYQQADKIFQQMEENGDLGKFFPATINPFNFNDTVAYLIDGSFTEDEMKEKGYLWRKEKVKVDIPEGMEVVDVRNLGEYEGFDKSGDWKINPDILKKVIRDEQGNVYRIVKMEYNFLMKYGLPLPRRHRLDRLKMNFRVE